jgi:hypothetical protein
MRSLYSSPSMVVTGSPRVRNLPPYFFTVDGARSVYLRYVTGSWNRHHGDDIGPASAFLLGDVVSESPSRRAPMMRARAISSATSELSPTTQIAIDQASSAGPKLGLRVRGVAVRVAAGKTVRYPFENHRPARLRTHRAGP